MSYTLILAEDQSLIRNSLELLLNNQNELNVIGTAANGKDALELCERTKPDIALLDIRMPGLSGIEVAQILRENKNPCKIVLLTTFQEDQVFSRALELGVEGIFLKDVDPDVFAISLRAIARGVLVYDPAVMTQLKEITIGCSDTQNPFGLTERDHVIIRRIAEGLSNKMIAGGLRCSEGTVKNRVSSILGKMGLEDRTQIAVYAIRNRIIEDLD